MPFGPEIPYGYKTPLTKRQKAYRKKQAAKEAYAAEVRRTWGK